MLLAVLTAAALLAVQAPFGAAQNAAEEGAAASGTAESWSLPSYSDWLARQGDAAEAKDTIRLTAEDYLSSQPGNTAKAADGQILLGEGTAASFTVTSPKGGLYALRIGYEAVPGESQFSSVLELSLAVNGETPYRECSRMTLSRAFGHTQPAFEQDDSGNDVQPDAQELTIPQEYTLSDGSRLSSGGTVHFAPARGKHTHFHRRARRYPAQLGRAGSAGCGDELCGLPRRARR